MSTLNPAQHADLLATLQARFESHPRRHVGVSWPDVLARLAAHPDALTVLHHMERTGGEPDVVAHDPDTGAITFVDCAAESPAGRRNTCFDRAARLGRKEAPPPTSAEELAAEIGLTLLAEADYRALQTLGAFDTKTSSWIATPPAIRQKGGALFADRRYDHVFVYHNGAASYYGARGFRGKVQV